MDDVAVHIVGIDDPRAAAAEASLDAVGFPLPLLSRVTWGNHFDAGAHELVIATATTGQILAAIGLESTRTRAMPGHSVLRIHAFEDAYATEAGSALLSGAAEHVANSAGVLSIIVELECRAERSRELLRNVLASLKFHERPAQRVPSHTLALDLTPNEELIFASFSETCRYKLRRVSKLGLQLDLLGAPSFANRMNAMLADTFARTGARAEVMDWQTIMSVSADVPHRSRIVGVFNGASRAPEDLMAYAWGVHNGERAIYHTGASVLGSGIRVPLMYPAMWDLMRWAKREGASWFDFGGVTQVTGDKNDAMRGISDFKRRFCRNEITLGEEWVFEPNQMKASIARFAGNSARWLRGRWSSHDSA